MINYFIALKRSFNFSSKTSRSQFWDFKLIDYIFLVLLWIPQLILGPIFIDLSMQVSDSTFGVDPEIRDTIYITLLTFGFLQVIYICGDYT